MGSGEYGLSGRGQRHLPRAFTLVEALAVVAILALLVGVLLPALASSRAGARAVKCMSNLRAQGQALAQFCAQSSGLFPRFYDGSDMPWTRSLVNKGYIDPAVFVCPSGSNANPADIMRGENLNTADYGLNVAWIGSGNGTYTTFQVMEDPARPANMSQIADPGRTITVAECCSANKQEEGNSTLSPCMGVGGGILDPRHGDGKKINVLWADSHVSAEVCPSALRKPYTAGASAYEFDPFRKGETEVKFEAGKLLTRSLHNGDAENCWDRE